MIHKIRLPTRFANAGVGLRSGSTGRNQSQEIHETRQCQCHFSTENGSNITSSISLQTLRSEYLELKAFLLRSVVSVLFTRLSEAVTGAQKKV